MQTTTAKIKHSIEWYFFFNHMKYSKMIWFFFILTNNFSSLLQALYVFLLINLINYVNAISLTSRVFFFFKWSLVYTKFNLNHTRIALAIRCVLPCCSLNTDTNVQCSMCILTQKKIFVMTRWRHLSVNLSISRYRTFILR